MGCQGELHRRLLRRGAPAPQQAALRTARGSACPTWRVSRERGSRSATVFTLSCLMESSGPQQRRLGAQGRPSSLPSWPPTFAVPPEGARAPGETMGGRRTWGGRRDLCLRETGPRLAAGWRVPSPRASSAPFGTQSSRVPASPSSSGPFPVLPRGSDGRDPFPFYVSRTTSRERRQTSAPHSFQDELPGRAVTRRGALGVVPEPGLTHPRTGHVAVPEVTHMRKPRPGKGPGRPQGRHGRSRAGGAVKTHESSPE